MTSSGFKSNDLSERASLTGNLLWLHICDVYTLLSKLRMAKGSDLSHKRANGSRRNPHIAGYIYGPMKPPSLHKWLG